MRFIDEQGGSLGLLDAASRGYPAGPGTFAPIGDGDLRPAVYAPDASYAETAASVIASLFPEDIDPFMAERLAARAFPAAPARSEAGEGILIADFAAGASGSAADAEAAFLAGILATAAKRVGPLLLLADGRGPEGAALSEAISGIKDLRLALLYPRGEPASGVKSLRLAREGGQVSLLNVRGDRSEIDRLIREAAGKSVAGMGVVAGGPANPARFAARIIELSSVFSILRTGAVDDLFLGVRAGDGRGFASCLWAWRLGLPIKGIVLSAGEKGILGLDASGRALVDRFDAERPGVIRSLALIQPVDRASATRARDELAEAGGTSLDLASSMTLVAAIRSLDAGLRGHARVLVPRGADPSWDDAEGPRYGLRDARVDAEIEPSLAALERALTA
jgi:hypothetical protein